MIFKIYFILNNLMIFYKLSNDIITKIYQFDNTHKENYDIVLKQLHSFIRKHTFNIFKYYFFEEEFFEYILYNLKNKYYNSIVLLNYYKNIKNNESNLNLKKLKNYNTNTL